jgi:hypothetical protein
LTRFFQKLDLKIKVDFCVFLLYRTKKVMVQMGMATKLQLENEVASGMARELFVAFGETVMVRIIKVTFAGKTKEFEIWENEDYSPYEYAEKLAMQNEGEKVELKCSVDGYSEYRAHRGWIFIFDEFSKLVDRWLEDELVWKESCSHASEWDMDIFELETDFPWNDEVRELKGRIKHLEGLISEFMGEVIRSESFHALLAIRENRS